MTEFAYAWMIIREQGAKSKEQRAKGKEVRAKGKEQNGDFERSACDEKRSTKPHEADLFGQFSVVSWIAPM